MKVIAVKIRDEQEAKLKAIIDSRMFGFDNRSQVIRYLIDKFKVDKE